MALLRSRRMLELRTTRRYKMYKIINVAEKRGLAIALRRKDITKKRVGCRYVAGGNMLILKGCVMVVPW